MVQFERLTVRGIELELLHRGTGHPVLALHGMQPIDPEARFLDILGREADIIAPSHPGFGGSPRPEDFDTIYDLAHLYLDVLAALPHERISLMGFSFGGWVAAEVAAACCHRIERLILVDAFGIKISDRETPDILDVFNTHPDEVIRRSWHHPEHFKPDFNSWDDDALIRYARGRESLSLYGFQPYMYNPQLKRWLARITVPTLVVWGAADGIVKPAYGEAYAGLIPGARFAPIAEAGHHPEIEQPQRFAELVGGFLAQQALEQEHGDVVAVRDPLSVRPAGGAGSG